MRDRVSAPGKIFGISSVMAAFKGAKKKDVEGLLDALAAPASSWSSRPLQEAMESRGKDGLMVIALESLSDLHRN